MKFANFEIDERAGILRRDGERLRLQDLPCRLLVILLNRAGEVVTRDELRSALWGSETFVDAEAGLNTAIAKIREALGDSAESPRFIETLPKRGYRFIGEVETASAVRAGAVNGAPTAVDAAQPAGRSSVQPSPPGPDWSAPIAPPARFRRWLPFVALGLILLAAGAWYFSTQTPDITIAVVRFHNETADLTNDQLASTLTDAVVVALAQDRRYSVIGNSPLLRTERIFADANKIGQALAADYVLLGQLQKSDTGLVVRAHLIRGTDQKHVWAAPIALPSTGKEAALTAATSEGVAKAIGTR